MGNKELRKGRYSERHRAYLITTVTARRARLFLDLRNARIVIRSLAHLHDQGMVTSLAYVLMPDHLHWLFILQDDSLSRIIQSFKGYTGKRLTERLQCPHRIWQPGFHDHALRSPRDIKPVARYVIANPLRAGLAERLEDYPHWDAIWLHRTLDI